MGLINKKDKEEVIDYHYGMAKKIANNIRSLAIDMIDNAKSGHPGIVLGAADIITTLYAYHIKVDPKNEMWVNRDRFILSAGHGSALLYSTLYMAGYFIKLDDLKEFRKLDSLTPGHPEYNVTPGVDMTTGPLGEGLATSVGIAIGETYLREQLPELIDYYTYVLCGDGDLMEGVSYEACSLAGHLKLNKLIVLYDSNDITLDGKKNDSFSENIEERFTSMNWNYILVKDGSSIEEINNAIMKAKTCIDKPTIIEIKTTIGKYSVNEGTNKVHGSPLTEEDIQSIKEKLEVKEGAFSVSEEAKEEFENMIYNRSNPYIEDFNSSLKRLSDERVDLLNRVINYKAPVKLSSIYYDIPDEMVDSTRNASGKVLNVIANEFPLILGGSADVAGSTKSAIVDSDYSSENRSGKTIHFGVRENAMASICNGLALCGLTPFASTFFTFSDFLKPGIRLSAMMDLPVIYLFSHDSISVGEDGPTHEPIEQLASLRAVPNLDVYRPADSNEVIGSYKAILESRKPSVMVLGRNNVRIEECTSSKDVALGAYALKWETSNLDAVIVATGEEVELAIDVYNKLLELGYSIRLISMPCMERFERQDANYRRDLIPSYAKTFVIEAGASQPWYKYTKNKDYMFTIDEFGASGSRKDVLAKYGYTVYDITNKIMELLK